jgi:cell wall-associated NlpC family hydrolase
VIKTEGAWAFIEAVEQAEYTHTNAWQGYPGWVRHDALKPVGTQPRSDGASQAVVRVTWATVWTDASASVPLMQVPMGAKLTLKQAKGLMWPLRLLDGGTAWISRGDVRLLDERRRLPVEHQRQAVVRAAERFLGDPYFWGGRSPYLSAAGSLATGVDCSGLANLAYRSVGIDIPRDAHEQYLRARTITVPKPADLVFLSAPDDPEKIVHVMLYAGDGWLIEGPGTGLAVRRIELVTRLGVSVDELTPGQRIGTQVIYLGTYFR